MSVRCLLGYHAYRYVGFRWAEAFPGCKLGYDHECARCGKHAHLRRGPVNA